MCVCVDVMGARSSQAVDSVVSRRYSSESEAVLVVRRRPHMVNGGGFVVSNSKQQVVFRVDGCGVLGTKGKLLLRNGDGDDLLLIRKMVTNFNYQLYDIVLISMKIISFLGYAHEIRVFFLVIFPDFVAVQLKCEYNIPWILW